MDHASFTKAETDLLVSATEQLPALGVALLAAEALSVAIDGDSVPDGDNAQYYLRSAIFVQSIMALRTARACCLVAGAGYAPEAHGLKRRLSEIHAWSQAICADDSGQRAREWLDGRGGTPRKVVNRFGLLELFDVYSLSAHADARGVHTWLTERSDDGTNGIQVMPRRDAPLANAMLTEVAMECHDLAKVQAAARGFAHGVPATLQGLDALQALIEEMVERYYAPAEADPAT